MDEAPVFHPRQPAAERADPERAIGIAVQRADVVGEQAVARGPRPHLAALPAVQPGGGADPERVRGFAHDAGDGAGKRTRRRHDLHAGGVALQQRRGIGAEPQRFAVGAQRANGFAAHGRIEKRLRRLARLKTKQALLARGPDRAVARRGGAVDDGMIRGHRRVRERGEAPVFKTLDAAARRADPQRARRILDDGRDGGRREAGVRAPVLQHARREPVQAAGNRARPDRAFAVSHHRAHALRGRAGRRSRPARIARRWSDTARALRVADPERAVAALREALDEASSADRSRRRSVAIFHRSISTRRPSRPRSRRRDPPAGYRRCRAPDRLPPPARTGHSCRGTDLPKSPTPRASPANPAAARGLASAASPPLRP